MSRKQSVILTPTEKKEAVAKAKDNLKTAKEILASVAKERKTLDATYAKDSKDLDKALATANKIVADAQAGVSAVNS